MRLSALVLGSLALVGCTSSTDNGPPLATPADVIIEVDAATLGNKAYDPNPLTFSLKDKKTVKWRNSDNADHTVTEDNGAFTSGTLGPGGTFVFAFTNPGTYNYHCNIHPTMVATITITP